LNHLYYNNIFLSFYFYFRYLVAKASIFATCVPFLTREFHHPYVLAYFMATDCDLDL